MVLLSTVTMLAVVVAAVAQNAGLTAEIRAACQDECMRLLKDETNCLSFCSWNQHLEAEHGHLQVLQKQLDEGLPPHYHRAAVRYAMHDAALTQFRFKKEDHEMSVWFVDHMRKVVQGLVKDYEKKDL